MHYANNNILLKVQHFLLFASFCILETVSSTLNIVLSPSPKLVVVNIEQHHNYNNTRKQNRPLACLRPSVARRVRTELELLLEVDSRCSQLGTMSCAECVSWRLELVSRVLLSNLSEIKSNNFQ